jgi:hypothetical protein
MGWNTLDLLAALLIADHPGIVLIAIERRCGSKEKIQIRSAELLINRAR